MRDKLATGIVRLRIPLLILLLIAAALSVPAINRTHINYDLNRYLSADTMTQRALKVMKEEFGSSEQLRLMFSNQDDKSMAEILSALNALEEVQLAVSGTDDVRILEGTTKRLVTLTLSDCDTAALIPRLRSMFPEAGEYYVGGAAAVQLDVQESVAEEIPEVMLISVAVVLTVLLLTSHAWLEPLVISLVLAVSIIINMGTNFIFESVSFITFAVCAILQLALSIDYAIMLLHTFNACQDDGLPAAQAMAAALAQTFMRIASSAFTTVAGLISLLFMSFTIGFDIGLVLSKGIVISMVCVFLLMPSLTLLLEKPLRRTRHKPLRLGGEYLARFILRWKKPIALLLILIVFCGIVLNSQNAYSFTDPGAAEHSESAAINRAFGTSNPLVLLVPGGETDEDYARQRALVDRLLALRQEDGEPAIRDVSAMVTTGASALEYYTPADVAALTGLNETAVGLFFRMQGFGTSVRADRLLDAAGPLSAGNENISALQEALASARKAFIGPNYARILLDLNFAPANAGFFASMDAILDAASADYADLFFVTGVPMSSYDIGNAFQADLLKVNIITLLAILLIVILSFRSLRLPFLLVFVIEGAIWITMGISRILGQTIFFISYLICLSIQMGATIDYGILLSDQYRGLRRAGRSVQEALAEALKKALPTILTSGIILITAGYIIGRRCSVFYIASIGALLARGTLVSVILVLTLLPALLTLCDRFLFRDHSVTRPTDEGAAP